MTTRSPYTCRLSRRFYRPINDSNESLIKEQSTARDTFARATDPIP